MTPMRVAVHPDAFPARRPAMLPSGGFATPLSKRRNISNAISQSGRYSYSTAPVDTTQPVIHDVFESRTGTWQYLVADPATKAAVIIDPVLDYDRTTQIITTSSADELLRLVKEKGYRVLRILETHAHADHLTAASYLQKRIAEEHGNKPQIGIGRRIGQVQDLFGQRYDVPSQERHGAFDKLFEDDESFSIDNVFCGDSLFHVDIGTARCDFPGGSANNLYHSGRRLLSLPDHVKVWTGHDYPPDDREGPVPWMTVSDHRKLNKHLRDGITEEEFVAQRKERDAQLGEPKLLHQSLQTNIRAGKLPQPTASGHRMLRVPMELGDLQW
ncbi:metallo-beta-lactamase superfamily protein [Colletotrichum paranaense]|uniref:Metallo-beta-lactamase superfamily protein n=1 Tax=Colletotrichum paranaense TaxID=1914294 RepID=A0ABQ9SCA7_9PEZI|nr:metallo-beta-lactamase superfamily protein [Colletotrichum paranaense]KAK1533141.1 metallo-beta-lactamase superfamily protein [Colletotrichum paranaense]